MKSLKHCDLDSLSARQPLCQYRAATIHHRLASMYHSCLRNQVRPPTRGPWAGAACLATRVFRAAFHVWRLIGSFCCHLRVFMGIG